MKAVLLIQYAFNRRKEIFIQVVKLKIKDVSDFLNLCNDDFQKALALYISFISTKGVNDVEIGEACRVAYRFDDFQKTNLYMQLEKWADSQSLTLFIHGKEN
jgi:hypothetical protein